MALLRFERFKEAVIAAKESVKQCPGQARTFLLIAHATSRYPDDSGAPGKLKERAKVLVFVCVCLTVCLTVCLFVCVHATSRYPDDWGLLAS